MTEDRRNFRPSDEHQQAIDDLFEEAKNWLTGAEITAEAEAEGVETLLKLTRDAHAAADAARATEKRPFDLAGKEVQARYLPILDRADTITNACKKLLTSWRKKLAARQEAEAAEQRRIAEEAAIEAARVTAVAQGDVGAMEIAKSATETAERFEKVAKSMERRVGKGLRMRTVRSGEIVELKETIAHYYRTERRWMMDIMQARVDFDAAKSAAPIPGVVLTETKEAY